MNIEVNKESIFFGSSNGYKGFSSNFSTIFSGKNLDKLFILKGGPGTGKSTLMKKLYSEFSNKGKITCFACSSDLNSIDGLIIEVNKTKVGIVDGTAPHSLDPIAPGSFDEIVNLGESIDSHGIETEKNRLLELNGEKAIAYKKAYNALNIAGSIKEYIFANIKKYDIYNEAYNQLSSFLHREKRSVYKDSVDEKLLGSFSKDGYFKFIDKISDKENIYVCGDGLSEYVLMLYLKDILVENGLAKTVYTSPFSNDQFDAITTNTHCFIISSDRCDVDTSFVTKSINSYNDFKEKYDFFMTESKAKLQDAAEIHFKMEEIYSQYLCFDSLNEQYEHLVKKINNLCIY